MAVLELYDEGGFEIDEDFRELPDHIAAELEFLYLLIYRENRGAADRRPRRAGSQRPACASAFSTSTSGAGSALSRSRDALGAQTAFYRELADLTERFVRRDLG